MEALVLFLAKAAASGTLGHYLKKGLERIDSQLRKMIEGKESPAKIADYIKSKSISAEVNDLASEILGNTILIPFDPGQGQPLDIRVEFFKQVLEAGYLLSKLWKADLALPGSILGPSSLTLFLADDASDHILTRTGVRMTIPQNATFSSLVVIPIKNSKELGELWQRYRSTFLFGKSNTNEHLKSTRSCPRW